ncbi:MAG: DNA repair protein RecN [Xanthomonadales bacterium]|nr:DNA repair protein RecN [Gammaproteobacteria bacterium]MBT8051957.1 DNA repair protein RecN [Gammaproteobacteria bacterium]NNL06061.1 DNA repair protein RecN [Xanthomonadales bacterium]
MLVFLHIRDYAIVDSLELECEHGFTCVTGETGAGKSILVGALGLLSGNRADSAAVRQDCDKAELSAGFELDEDSPALEWLREQDLDDDRDCLLRRVVHSNGRSRAWINGTAVTLQQLDSLGESLVEIHGQNEHLRLAQSAEQLALLDAGHHETARRDLRDRYFAWHALEMEKQALLGQAPLEAGDLELLRYQLEELENGLLSPDAFSALENQHRKLAHGGEIVGSLETTLADLDSEPRAVSATLHRCARALQDHAELDEDIATAARMLQEAAINCDEAGSAIQAALSRMDLSPERLAELERQLTAQHDLARKHRVEPEQLLRVRHELTQRLERAAEQQKRLAVIDAELEAALRAYRHAARAVHEKRAQRAGALSKGVTELMQQLGMEGGRFELDVHLESDRPPSARGDDRVQIRVSANRGIDPGPLRKVASGGELSRIGLAVKIVARQHGDSVVQVFDEVDAGIGGATATTVGSLLKRLSSDGQALCVTHLAQVAVFADQQVCISKQDDGAVTSVAVHHLGESARVEEVARMLGGQISAQSRAHAAELLKEAGAARH